MTKFGTSISPPRIPKIIHFCWIPTLDKIPADRVGNIARWKKLNPEYTVELWDEPRITKEFDQEFLDEYHKLDSYVKKSDFARCWILAKYGGLYLDVDLVPLRSLQNMMEDDFCYGRIEVGNKELVDYSKYDFIFSREYRRIDRHGHCVANGVVFTKPTDLWTDFLRSRFEHRNLQVLKSFGPHALTYYIRPLIKDF